MLVEKQYIKCYINQVTPLFYLHILNTGMPYNLIKFVFTNTDFILRGIVQFDNSKIIVVQVVFYYCFVLYFFGLNWCGCLLSVSLLLDTQCCSSCLQDVVIVEDT